MEIKGSVKRILVTDPPSPERLGRGIMVFSDSFSVFDFGEMPQSIPYKSRALKSQSLYWFHKLEAEGIPTHLIRDLDESSFEIKLGHRLRFQELAESSLPGCCLIPLELIFRNYILPYSSARQRLDQLGVSYTQLSSGLIKLDQPVVEFFSKGEKGAGDEYLSRSWVESKLGPELTQQMEALAHRVNQIITQDLEPKGIIHLDGKIELLKYRDQLMIADAVGTLDENRFLYRGYDLSKQLLRDYYASTPWYKQWQAAKSSGKMVQPPRLPQDFIQLVSRIYAAMTYRITGQLWESPPDLDSLLDQLGRYGVKKLI